MGNRGSKSNETNLENEEIEEEEEEQQNKDEDDENAKSSIINYGEFDKFFVKYDEDRNGKLNQLEFQECIKGFISLHPEHEKNLIELLQNLEIHNDNQLTKEEFRKIMAVYSSDEISIDTLIEVFRCFDLQSQGKVGPEEIKHVFFKLGFNIDYNEAIALVKDASLDVDNEVDFEEFIKILISK